MSLTLREAIDKTLRRVLLAAGPNVQVYAEEQLVDIIQHKFDVLFDDMWWPQFFNPGEEFTLNGTDGQVVDDLTTKIKRYQDVKHVWLDSYPTPLSRINGRVSPNTITAYSYGPVATDKILSIYPQATTGTVRIAYRSKPDDFTDSADVIDMDTHLIVMGAAYDYLNGLGYNAGAEQKLLTMFNERYNQLKSQVEHVEVSTDAQYGLSLSGWQDAPW